MIGGVTLEIAVEVQHILLHPAPDQRRLDRDRTATQDQKLQAVTPIHTITISLMELSATQTKQR